MKAGIVWRVLMGGLMLASAVTAQAGGAGGGGETPVLVPLECYSIIKGTAANRSVTLVDSEFFDAARTVKVGVASMACTPVTANIPGTDPPVLAFDPDPLAAHYKCYSISGPAVQETVSLASPLDTEEAPQTTLSQSRFLCIPSTTP